MLARAGFTGLNRRLAGLTRPLAPAFQPTKSMHDQLSVQLKTVSNKTVDRRSVIALRSLGLHPCSGHP
jgi:hypothetical protein